MLERLPDDVIYFIVPATSGPLLADDVLRRHYFAYRAVIGANVPKYGHPSIAVSGCREFLNRSPFEALCHSFAGKVGLLRANDERRSVGIFERVQGGSGDLTQRARQAVCVT